MLLLEKCFVATINNCIRPQNGAKSVTLSVIVSHYSVPKTLSGVAVSYMKRPISFSTKRYAFSGMKYKREKAAGTAAPSKQPTLQRSWHDLVSLGVKDTESWRGWARERRRDGGRMVGGIVEEVG